MYHVNPARNPRYLFIRDAAQVRKKLVITQAEELLGIKWLEWSIDGCDVCDNLEICYMNNYCGWGLFAKEKISKGKLIGFFTGEIRLQQTNKIPASENVFFSISNDGMIIVDATQCGNVTRYLQHLPNRETLCQYEFRTTKESEIATQNIHAEIVTFGDVVTVRFCASEDIEPGHIIGCPYDLPEPDYFQNKKLNFFKKNGDVIDPHPHKK